MVVHSSGSYRGLRHVLRVGLEQGWALTLVSFEALSPRTHAGTLVSGPKLDPFRLDKRQVGVCVHTCMCNMYST